MSWRDCGKGSCHRHERCMYLNHPLCGEKSPVSTRSLTGANRVAPKRGGDYHDASNPNGLEP